jgi:ubiquinone/menaquinone biosynthesis C-methylase UbiE
MLTKELASKTWNQADYYAQAKDASENDHPSLKVLTARYRGKQILEVACGEGTKLSQLEAKRRVGLDISKLAIKQAAQKLDLAVVGNAESLPFKNGEFDAVLSFFSLEHFEHPETVLLEMIRVIKKGGEVVVLTPNFGAPNRCSPCFVGSRVGKLLRGLWQDLVGHGKGLPWNHVTPLSIEHAYQSDFDTLVEPYLLTLMKYLKSCGLEIVMSSSNWEVQMESENILQKIIRILGTWSLYPFKYWGPHAFVIARRTK